MFIFPDRTYRGYSLERFAVKDLGFRFPMVRYRYVKVTIPHDEDKDPVELKEVEVFQAERVEALENEFVQEITRAHENPETKSTEVVMDLGFRNLPISRVEIVTEAQNFFRRVEIENSNEVREWKKVGEGHIFSVAIQNETNRNLSLRFGEAQGRYLRLKVFNGDSAPIKIAAVKACSLKRFVIFWPQSAETYSLWYGHSKAREPVYDVVSVAKDRRISDFEKGSLLEETRNPNYESVKESKPWTEERPYLLWLVLGMILLGLLGLATQVVRKVDEK